MKILGLGFVGGCMFLGSVIGVNLGKVLGISGNVGGVGFAMLFLVLISNRLESKNRKFHEETKDGILFLSAIYIPVVVAMSANQNVAAAISGGVVALLAGSIATIGSLFLIPLIKKIIGSNTKAIREETK